MSVSEKTIEYVESQLREFENFRMRSMFGGIGIFKDEIMFGMISSKEKLYFRTDPQNAGDYESAGMQSFFHKRAGRGMPYYEVPMEVQRSPEKLAQWAQAAYLAAERARKK